MLIMLLLATYPQDTWLHIQFCSSPALRFLRIDTACPSCSNRCSLIYKTLSGQQVAAAAVAALAVAAAAAVCNCWRWHLRFAGALIN